MILQIAYLTVIVMLVIFKIAVKKMIFFSLTLILFSLPMVLLKRYEAAEILANFAYGILFVAVLKLFKETV